MARIGSIAFAFASWFVLGGSFILVPNAANAQQVCRWQMGGKWTIYQRNGWRVDVNLTQDRGWISGNTFHPKIGTGNIRGAVNDNDVTMEIDWSNHHTGIYQGKVQPQWSGSQQDMVLTGSMFDTQRPWDRTECGRVR